jgi:hypothetical protein
VLHEPKTRKTDKTCGLCGRVIPAGEILYKALRGHYHPKCLEAEGGGNAGAMSDGSGRVIKGTNSLGG